MLHYLRRARALASTVDRLEGEVRALQDRLQEVEDRSGRTAERARLEALAAERRVQALAEQVEKAAASLLDQARSSRVASERPRPIDAAR